MFNGFELGDVSKYANKETLTVIGALLALFVVYKGAMMAFSLVKTVTFGIPKTLVLASAGFVGGAATVGNGIDTSKVKPTPSSFTQEQLIEIMKDSKSEKNMQTVFDFVQKQEQTNPIMSSGTAPVERPWTWTYILPGIATMLCAAVAAGNYESPTVKK